MLTILFIDLFIYVNIGTSGTIPGVFCEVCEQFFGFDESQFADSIADHCISLKHHLYIKVSYQYNAILIINKLHSAQCRDLK